jgi:predicted amidophosphoribosyltransferase
MSIANCTRCGRMFQRTGTSRVCFECKEAEEQAYRLVRDYLEAHPGSDIASVAAGTGVDEAIVLKLLQDGRLVALGDLTSGMQTQCQRCGNPTNAGRYCPPCVELLGQALKNSADVLADKPDSATRLRRPETLQEKRGGHSSSRPDRR